MKRVLITWWTKGIGYAIAEKFAREWYDICITYFHDNKWAEFSINKLKEIWVDAIAIQANSWNKNDLQKVFDIYWKTNILINNIWSYLPDLHEWDWEDMFNHHLMWTVRSTELFAEQLEWKWKIVNISSVAGHNPWAWHKCIWLESYCCMKAAVNMYTKICANKFWWKILVNAISPWNTSTPARDWADKNRISCREKNSVIWRFIKPEEIAKIVYATIDNEWINGQIVTVDGGEVARWYEID